MKKILHRISALLCIVLISLPFDLSCTPPPSPISRQIESYGICKHMFIVRGSLFKSTSTVFKVDIAESSSWVNLAGNPPIQCSKRQADINYKMRDLQVNRVHDSGHCLLIGFTQNHSAFTDFNHCISPPLFFFSSVEYI